MKHLFVINPIVAKIKGKVNSVIKEINMFFEQYTHIDYDIHVTRWSRDASAFVRRYASESSELLRVHVMGGSGTLFEVVNGIIGLPNVQVAAYPMGRSNYFLRYFGDDKTHLFASIRNQVFSGVTAIDAFRCGNNFGISHGLVGTEAMASRDGMEMIEKTHLPSDFCFIWSVMKNLMKKNISLYYRISLDERMLDGEFISMMIANTPCYGKNMNPAPDAHPNDERLEMYMIKDMPRQKRLSTIRKYSSGNYHKMPDRISHYSGSKISISSDDVIGVSVDGEMFYENSIEFEVIPYALDFVCPVGVDPSKIPRFRTRPEEGFVDER